MMLRIIRITFAIVIFTLITFYFLDFTNTLPFEAHILLHFQFIPALLAGSIGIVVFLLLLTLLLGRIYCSAICPLGVFQDVVSWISGKFSRKRKYKYSKEKKILRYIILAATVIAFFAGGGILVSLLDPYGAFGRMTTNVFRPVYMASNNLLATIFNHFDNFTFYDVNIYTLSLFSLIIGLLTFLVVAFLAWRYGRTYCNTICPVGTVLGFVSKFSILKVHINEQTCNNCGLCEMKCKSSCIDSKNGFIDHSRCVDCYNCLNVCKKKAISYKFVLKKKELSKPIEPDPSKRTFLSVIAASALAIPGKMLAQGLEKSGASTGYRRQNPLSPPGSGNTEHLLSHCTACHLCVSKCPSHVLKPAFMEYGPGGMMQPMMDFEHGFCNYDCTVCSSVCPNGALHKLTKEKKHTLQMGRVVFIKTNCIVYRDNTSCGACSEHCPTQAVSMIPYKNGLTIPSVNPDICVGCGGCEFICPARPFRAIYVEGNPVHLQAKRFKEAKTEEVKLESFGF